MAMTAAVLNRFPANHMTVIGVTGTNGKTTTSNLLHHIFTQAGHKVGLLTTVNFKIGEREEANLNKQTTLSPFLLQKKLREMADAGCDTVIVEATSHAMMQSRLWGVNVDTALFTNLTQDHLNYHVTMEEYRAAKEKLFASLNISSRKPNTPKLAVINQDDSAYEYFAQHPADQIFSYGLQKGAYLAQDLIPRPNGTQFTLRIPNGEVIVDFPIPGRMNVYNALAAATVAVAHRISLPVIKQALETVKPVPGRIEMIEEGQPYSIVVDFAHAEDALKQLLSMFKELTFGRLIVVFGAVGNGDQGKRPKMGAVVHQYADLIVLTNDDIFTEDPRSIAAMVRGGISREEGNGFWQILDRREAIRFALAMARPGDTVVIAGKGAEEFQMVGRGKVPHDDRRIVRELLSREVDVDLPN
jgi:UDP-N-acetylmuramoyl-L-alanyl-D-glutamate--2,6-diaminopimelate ligase